MQKGRRVSKPQVAEHPVAAYHGNSCNWQRPRVVWALKRKSLKMNVISRLWRSVEVKLSGADPLSFSTSEWMVPAGSAQGGGTELHTSIRRACACSIGTAFSCSAHIQEQPCMNCALEMGSSCKPGTSQGAMRAGAPTCSITRQRRSGAGQLPGSSGGRVTRGGRVPPGAAARLPGSVPARGVGGAPDTVRRQAAPEGILEISVVLLIRRRKKAGSKQAIAHSPAGVARSGHFRRRAHHQAPSWAGHHAAAQKREGRGANQQALQLRLHAQPALQGLAGEGGEGGGGGEQASLPKHLLDNAWITSNPAAAASR